MKNSTEIGAPISEILMMILSALPRRLSAEITRVCSSRRDFPIGLSEIRVRTRGSSSLVISGENVRLFSRVSESEMRDIYDRALGGALYAHGDEVRRGFISMPYGVRVGISSSQREDGLLPTEVTSLVFRLPSAESEVAGGIFALWQKKRPRGMLLYSAPGGGKTSALRALARLIGRECAMRVAVIDSRREFSGEDYSGCSVDLLSGYEKAAGIELAMRSLAPEVIIIDEIGNDRESLALLSVGSGGIPIIASAHADSLSELMRRECIKRLYENGYLDMLVRLKRVGSRFSFESEATESEAAR